jgi:hypothetical protein
MILETNSDEMLLIIMGLVRKINPAMLKAESDGFSVDFSPLEGKKELSSDELLLVKLRTVAESEELSLDINATEARQLGASLERLEKLQSWPGDVISMSRTLRSKLATVV